MEHITKAQKKPFWALVSFYFVEFFQPLKDDSESVHMYEKRVYK